MSRIALIPVVLVLAAAAGVVVGLVSRLVYLVIAFPIVMGFVAALLAGLTYSRQLRLITLLVGLVCGLLIYGGYRATRYFIERQNLIDQSMQQYGISAERASRTLDEVLKEETGSDGFIGYVKAMAKEGISITSSRSSSSPINLDEKATWIYWGIEILIVVGLGAVGGFQGGTNRNRRTAAYQTPPSVPPSTPPISQ